ncbi:MAG: helix-hairpin-helix domain-containing protein, partial [Gemmatimonadales bacterium]|nr:helix-hairpin-helix domain-containing protein [Gemmatimonadales bacterium]
GFDPNRAGVAEWDALPGIGPTRAKAIVAFRDSAGPFRRLDDLRRVPGLPASVLRGLAAHLQLP